MVVLTRVILIAVLLSSATAGPASASDYMQAYREHVAALERGDRQAAAEAGERAWRLAEDEIGGSRETALLAYNFASLVYWDRPEDAIAPFVRAGELLGPRADAFGAEDPELGAALCRARRADANAADHKALDQLIDRRRASGETAASIMGARALQMIANRRLEKRQTRKAIAAADEAVDMFRAVAPAVKALQASPLMTGAAARIADIARRSRRDARRQKPVLVEVYRALDDIIEMFGPQTSIETFDPILAVAYGWSAAAGALEETLFDGDEQPSAAEMALADRPAGYGAVKWADGVKPADGECAVVWLARKAPPYPQGDANRGTVGAVVVGYHIGEQGLAEGVRVLSEVPEKSKFSEFALKAVETWRADTASLANPQCRRNRLVVFKFALQL
ncbi:MAG: energy transducer TonB [Pseudomonadota bacterium]